MRKILLMFASFALWGCGEKDPGPTGKSRLDYSVFVFEDPEEINRFWTDYTYNKSGLLISRVLHDTTFLLKSNLYRPVKTVTDYIYDKDGFLTERRNMVSSTASSSTSITTYSYFNQLLIRERTETREIVYNYDNESRLINTVSTTLSTGAKTVALYKDDVPESWEKDGEGYISRSPSTVQYFDKNLLLKKAEHFVGEVIAFQEDWTYAEARHPLATINDWKGFPKIKAIAYRTAVEKNIRKYARVNGGEINIEEKMLSQEFNEKGLLLSSKGQEKLKMNTAEPFLRKINLKYVYESY